MKQKIPSTKSDLTKALIDSAPTKDFDPLIWKPLLDFFWERYNKRYFDQIDVLRHHDCFDIRDNCGFLMASIDCILIETLEQYYNGKDETSETNEAFLSFFKRAPSAFSDVIKDKGDAGKFAGFIRAGLLHQSKTKKASIINRKSSSPILAWIDESQKHKGFVLNRDKFHDCVFKQYQQLIKKLKMPEESVLRQRFKDKLATLL